MSLINRIEVANFVALRDQEKWTPMMPHLVFNLGGKNSLIRLTNGLGKTSIVNAVLALLGRNRDLFFNRTRRDKMAPLSAGFFSHIRVETVKRAGHIAQEDMIGKLGADVPGEKHVFGLYGNSGTDAPYGFYCYRGVLEDCPVAETKDHMVSLVSNAKFKECLKKMKDLKQSSSYTDDDFMYEVGKHFELSDINKMIVYQRDGAGDSLSNFYKVKERRNESYGASFFYTHLAPELLTNLMGEDGEPDEKFVEHTIYNSTIIVRKAKRKCDEEQKVLLETEKKLNALRPAIDKRQELASISSELDRARKDFAQAAAVIEAATVKSIIPGIPNGKHPDDAKISKIISSLVMLDGSWYVVDRGIAEICDEEASDVNKRADRKKIDSESSQSSQVIEIPCHHGSALISRPQGGGPPNRLYRLDDAVKLIDLSPRFTQGWTKETAIVAVRAAFQWAETADTNIFRKEAKNIEFELSLAESKISELNKKITDCDGELRRLADARTQLEHAAAEYRKMADSSLFTEDELKQPSITGSKVAAEVQRSQDALKEHRQKMGEFQQPHINWLSFKSQYGENADPKEKIAEIENGISTSEKRLNEERSNLESFRKEKADIQKALDSARSQHQELIRKKEKLEDLRPFVDEGQKWFGTIIDPGLPDRIINELTVKTKRKDKLREYIVANQQFIEALEKFRKLHPTINPDSWIEECSKRLDRAKESRIACRAKMDDLKRRRTELEKAQVASGEMYSRALEVVGTEALPLYKAVESYALDQKRKEDVLTLFSNFLFAPVVDSIDLATIFAKKLDQQKIEVPVFIDEELERFCKSGEINVEKGAAYTYFSGVRTRPVDCLLNPELIEEEKRSLDEEISSINNELSQIEAAIVDLNPESEDLQISRKAAVAVSKGIEKEVYKANHELAEIEPVVIALQNKKQKLHLIESMAKFEKLGGDAALRGALENIETTNQEISQKEHSISALDQEITKTQEKETVLLGEFKAASAKFQDISVLKEIERFINRDGPSFMVTAETVARKLDEDQKAAVARDKFQFTLVQKFVEQGGQAKMQELDTFNANNMTIRQEAIDERKNIVDIQTKRREHKEELSNNAIRLDDIARALLAQYRKVSRILLAHKELTNEQTFDTEYLQKVQDVIHKIAADVPNNFLLQNMNELRGIAESINIDSLKFVMDSVADKLRKIEKDYEGEINHTIKNADVSFSETDRAWILEGKEKPEKLQEMFDILQKEYESRLVTHQAAVVTVEQSKETLTQRIVNLISRLRDNFELLKRTVNWRKRSDGTVEPGYEVNAKIIGMEELPTLIDRIIAEIEIKEKRRDEDRAAGIIESHDDADILEKIKSTFFREVFKDPSIRVLHPMVGAKSHPFTEKFSGGQRMALNLLWMLKIADYAVEREVRREAASFSQLKRLREQQERMFIIDGMFSNLSDSRIIKETLSAIGRLKTKVQLIGYSGHVAHLFRACRPPAKARERWTA